MEEFDPYFQEPKPVVVQQKVQPVYRAADPVPRPVVAEPTPQPTNRIIPADQLSTKTRQLINEVESKKRVRRLL